jgi:hypothetical protein
MYVHMHRLSKITCSSSPSPGDVHQEMKYLVGAIQLESEAFYLHDSSYFFSAAPPGGVAPAPPAPFAPSGL